MAMNIPNFLTPAEAEKILAERLRALRLQAGYKRTTLAERAGVTAASLKRFETTGQISLKNLLRLANALGCLQEFSKLFPPPEAKSLAELKAHSEKSVPKRGKI